MWHIIGLSEIGVGHLSNVQLGRLKLASWPVKLSQNSSRFVLHNKWMCMQHVWCQWECRIVAYLHLCEFLLNCGSEKLYAMIIECTILQSDWGNISLTSKFVNCILDRCAHHQFQIHVPFWARCWKIVLQQIYGVHLQSATFSQHIFIVNLCSDVSDN